MSSSNFLYRGDIIMLPPHPNVCRRVWSSSTSSFQPLFLRNQKNQFNNGIIKFFTKGSTKLTRAIGDTYYSDIFLFFGSRRTPNRIMKRYTNLKLGNIGIRVAIPRKTIMLRSCKQWCWDIGRLQKKKRKQINPTSRERWRPFKAPRLLHTIRRRTDKSCMIAWLSPF